MGGDEILFGDRCSIRLRALPTRLPGLHHPLRWTLHYDSVVVSTQGWSRKRTLGVLHLEGVFFESGSMTPLGVQQKACAFLTTFWAKAVAIILLENLTAFDGLVLCYEVSRCVLDIGNTFGAAIQAELLVGLGLVAHLLLLLLLQGSRLGRRRQDI